MPGTNFSLKRVGLTTIFPLFKLLYISFMISDTINNGAIKPVSLSGTIPLFTQSVPKYFNLAIWQHSKPGLLFSFYKIKSLLTYYIFSKMFQQHGFNSHLLFHFLYSFHFITLSNLTFHCFIISVKYLNLSHFSFHYQ